jgi:hypothetical protein
VATVVVVARGTVDVVVLGDVVDVVVVVVDEAGEVVDGIVDAMVDVVVAGVRTCGK